MTFPELLKKYPNFSDFFWRDKGEWVITCLLHIIYWKYDIKQLEFLEKVHQVAVFMSHMVSKIQQFTVFP